LNQIYIPIAAAIIIIPTNAKNIALFDESLTGDFAGVGVVLGVGSGIGVGAGARVAGARVGAGASVGAGVGESGVIHDFNGVVMQAWLLKPHSK